METEENKFIPWVIISVLAAVLFTATVFVKIHSYQPLTGLETTYAISSLMLLIFSLGRLYNSAFPKREGQQDTPETYQETFETFMHFNPAVAWMKDDKGQYVYVNGEFCRKFLLTKEEIIGKTDHEILGDAMVDHINLDDQYVVESGQKIEIYEDVPTPDGVMKNWWVHKFRIQNSSNEIFTAGIGFDITDKKKAERALEESEKRFRLISENSKDLVCLHHKDGRYAYVSPSSMSLLGYRPEEMLEKHPNLFYHPEDLKTIREYAAAGIEHDEVFTVRFRKKDGSYLWVETNRTTITGEKQKEHYQTVSRDISHRKAAEKEISQYLDNLIKMNGELKEAKEIAEKSVKIREEFIAHTSHEIRTPMNAIIGLTRMMLESKLNSEQKEYLEAIAKSGDTLLGVLNDILDLSKIEAGKMTFEEIPFDIRENIRYMIDLIRPKTLEKNISLEYIVEKNVPLHLSGDPVRLNQILMNILSNAIKFTHNGGVKLLVKNISATNGSAKINFSIADTGIGIPEDKLEMIFSGFSQANISINRKYGGSGLGLSIVKKLIDLQGGEIKVDSTLNQGSCFSVSLDFKVNHAPADEIISQVLETDNRLAGSYGLLVEDNRLNQLVSSKVLQGFGMNIDIAEDGMEALKLIDNHNYDIVFMDIHMPGISGLETAGLIRQKQNGQKGNIPIIAMSANPMSSEKDACLNAGINEYISKPFDTRNLFNKIVKLMKTDVEMTGNDTSMNDSERITNLSYLRDLADGSKSFIEEILVMFIDVIPKSLNELEESLGKKDWEGMKLIAHKMKPSYGFVGVKSAEDLMQRIEKNSSELPDSMLLGEMISHARILTDQCIIELKDELAHLDK